jgi:hypothetical protein
MISESMPTSRAGLPAEPARVRHYRSAGPDLGFKCLHDSNLRFAGLEMSYAPAWPVVAGIRVAFKVMLVW